MIEVQSLDFAHHKAVYLGVAGVVVLLLILKARGGSGATVATASGGAAVNTGGIQIGPGGPVVAANSALAQDYTASQSVAQQLSLQQAAHQGVYQDALNALNLSALTNQANFQAAGYNNQLAAQQTALQYLPQLAQQQVAQAGEQTAILGTQVAQGQAQANQLQAGANNTQANANATNAKTSEGKTAAQIKNGGDIVGKVLSWIGL